MTHLKRALQQDMTQEQIREAFKKKGSKSSGTSKAKDEFFSDLEFWLKKNQWQYKKEFVFSKKRKFRFDLCIPFGETGIAVEYNGVVSDKSRHTTLTGYSKDMEKINLAQIQGWKVLQYTVLNKSEVYSDLEKLLKLPAPCF